MLSWTVTAVNGRHCTLAGKVGEEHEVMNPVERIDMPPYRDFETLEQKLTRAVEYVFLKLGSVVARALANVCREKMDLFPLSHLFRLDYSFCSYTCSAVRT